MNNLKCHASAVASTIALIGAMCVSTVVHADDDDRKRRATRQFERISSFFVCDNTSCDRDVVDETVAEITAVSRDGNTLIYTDSPQESIGFVDITNPKFPKGLGIVKLDGEPTSVAVAGKYALVGVNTSVSLLDPSGHLAVFDVAACLESIAGCAPIARLDVQGQPDSVAVSPDRRYAAIAVENERDEDIVVNGVEGGLPQQPAGHLAIVRLKKDPVNWKVRIVELAGLAGYGSDDPEPEYVAINRANVAAVTLQENNHIVLVHLPTGKIVRHFPAGVVTLEGIDVDDNNLIEFNAIESDIPREPDAIAWLGNRRLVTANEGDLFGGSRGFTIFDGNGRVRFDAGNSFEYLAIRHGHFPEDRADAKGAEPESVTSARYGRHEYLFVGSERGSFVAVYEMRGDNPEFLQVLPTGIAPEGLLAIPQRGLLIAATENDDEWRTQINIFALKRGQASYPHLVSANQDNASLAEAPIAWGALSALAADFKDENILYSVPDSYYKQSRIYRVNVAQTPAVITDEIPLLKNGASVDYDLEGIALRSDGGYWLASEGAGTSTTRNLLIEVAKDGTVLNEIRLPANVEALQRSNGFEGVAVTGSGIGEKVYVAFQREWDRDPSGFVRIGEYKPASDTWGFYYYPLDAVESPAGGWVGLSELISLGDGRFATIERDNQGGPDARIKRVYVFSIAGLSPQSQGGAIPQVTKYLALDLLPALQSFNGWVLDKVEGLTVAADGQVYAVTDNDGVDDASGETRLLRLGKTLH